MAKVQADTVDPTDPGRAGVDPYPTGRLTTREYIEAGTQQEEIRSNRGVLSKRQAIDAGRELLVRMKGRGWRLKVWQNMGWHFRVWAGALMVFPPEPGRSKDGYSAMLDEVLPSEPWGPSGGSLIWRDPSTKRYKDPNAAAKAELEGAQRRLDALQHVVTTTTAWAAGSRFSGKAERTIR